DSQLAVGRRRAPPEFHSPCRILARSSGSRWCCGVGVAPRKPCKRELHVRSDVGQQYRLRPRNVRQLAATEQINGIRTFGEEPPGAAISPFLVARQRTEILRPAFYDFVGTGNILCTDRTANSTKRSS